MNIKNITKLDDQKYEIYFSYTDDLTGKRRRIRRRFNCSLAEAIEHRNRLKTQAQNGELGRSHQTERPLSQWVDDYLYHRNGQVADSTFEIESYQYRGPIIDDVGDWRPEHVELHHVDEQIRQWESEDLSVSTVKNRRALLIRLLRWTFKRIDKNPAFLRDVEGVKKRKIEQTGRSMNPEEAKRFLNVFRDLYPQHFALVYTLLVTGQRWGSTTALRWTDVDFGDSTISFATSHYRGEVKQGNKSGKVVRLPMPDALSDVLTWHRQRMIEQQHVNLDTGLVFPTSKPAAQSASDGYQVSGDLRHPFKQVCKKADIDPVTPHDLRRTHNTWMVDQGVNGSVIRSITGHTDEAMTDRYYRGDERAKSEALGTVLKLVEQG